MRTLSRIGLLAVGAIPAILMVLAFPQPLFAHQMTYGRYHLWSDRPIDAAAARGVLDDAQRRIARSEFYSPDQSFRVFICNDNWRLALYSQRLSGAMGGVADGWLTRNIYLREADIPTNRLIPPSRKADMTGRTLAYYVAHEATHVMESRALGRLAAVQYPVWMMEGYADYVGKAGAFDVAQNLAALKAGAPEMDPKASGLYRRYHLAVAYELDHRGLSAQQMFESKVSEGAVIAALMADHDSGVRP
jgi:hypothetical protein